MSHKIEPSVNGLVNIAGIEDEHYDAEAAFELAEELIDAGYRSQSVQRIDAVMSRHRGKYVEEYQPEWQLLNEVWRELRLEFGYDDNPRRGATP